MDIVIMSSELIRSPSISNIQARIGGKLREVSVAIGIR